MKLLKLVPDNTNIDFMKWRNIALILSIIATVGSLVLVGVRGLNLGIDFVGGQVVRATFAQPVAIEDLRNRVDQLNVGEASIQESGGPIAYTPGGTGALAIGGTFTPQTQGANVKHKHPIPSQGGGSPHNNMQPFIASHFLIKV